MIVDFLSLFFKDLMIMGIKDIRHILPNKRDLAEPNRP